jgi:hypothetical protein
MSVSTWFQRTYLVDETYVGKRRVSHREFWHLRTPGQFQGRNQSPNFFFEETWTAQCAIAIFGNCSVYSEVCNEGYSVSRRDVVKG